MREFMFGLLATQSFIAALFFLKYWRTAHDRFFLFFALAFLAMALNWTGLSSVDAAKEPVHLIYLLRLIAFVLIITGIVDKNRRTLRMTSPSSDKSVPGP